MKAQVVGILERVILCDCSDIAETGCISDIRCYIFSSEGDVELFGSRIFESNLGSKASDDRTIIGESVIVVEIEDHAPFIKRGFLPQGYQIVKSAGLLYGPGAPDVCKPSVLAAPLGGIGP